MTASVLATIAATRDRLAHLDPALYSSEDCAAVTAALAGLAKTCDAAVARFAARAAAGGAHRAQGFVAAGDWLASETGTSTVEARRDLDVAAAVAGCPDTAAAFAAGELSVAQAREIAAAEAVSPGSERDLLDVARRKPLRVLQDESRRARLAVVDAETLADRQRRSRRFRHWRDGDGMVCGSFALAPAEGAAVISRLDAEARAASAATRNAAVTVSPMRPTPPTLWWP